MYERCGVFEQWQEVGQTEVGHLMHVGVHQYLKWTVAHITHSRNIHCPGALLKPQILMPHIKHMSWHYGEFI